MPTRQERLNYAIAVARATGNVVEDKSLTGLATKCVPCTECDGTGMSENASMRNQAFCNMCSGRGYVSVSKPKPCQAFPSLDSRRNGTR